MALKLNERYPGRFSNPSADYPQGSFKNRTTPTSKDGSYLEKDWANDKEGFFQSLLSSAGVTANGSVDKVGASQYFDALMAAIRKTTILTDTGTANTYAAANSPALTTLPATGYLQRVNIANANTGASTYAPDGLAARPIYGLALQPLQGGELPAGVAVLMYLVQAGVNSGNGAWVIIESLGGAAQVPSATRSLHAPNAGQIQAQSLTAFTTAGTAPAFTLTPTPAVTTYAANQRFQVLFSAAGGAAPTLNISGLGAKNLKQYNSAGSKIAALISSGQIADVVYDGTDWVVLDQLPGTSGVTAPQFDNSTSLATTAFVQGVGSQFSNLTTITTNTTLNAAAHAGALVVGNSASAITATLPSANSMPAKSLIKVFAVGVGGITVAAAGSDTIYLSPNSVASYTLSQGAWVTLASNGSSLWYVVDQPGIGVGQKWTDFTGGRASGTTYTNTTGRPILVVIQGNNSGSAASKNIMVDGSALFIVYGDQGSTLRTSVTFVVPNGSTYSATIANIGAWGELR